MRLIDADAFKRQIAAAAVQTGTAEAASRAGIMMDLIDNQPTIQKNTGSDKSDVYVFEGKELSAEELIVELAEHSKIFLDFEGFEEHGVLVDL